MKKYFQYKSSTMRTKSIITIFFLLYALFGYAQTGVINNGAKIIIQSGAVMDIDGGSSADYTNQSYDAAKHGRIDIDGKIEIEGDLFNNATGEYLFINRDTDGEVLFNGSTSQSIGGTRYIYFEKLTLNNSSGLNLNYSTKIYGNLTLTDGVFDLGTKYLYFYGNSILGSFGNTAKLDGSSAYIYWYINSDGTYTLPVGDASYYTPFTYSITGGSYNSTAYFRVRLYTSKLSSNSSTTDYINRYWYVYNYGFSSSNVSLSAIYSDTDVVGTESNLYGGHYKSPYWTKLSAVNTSTNEITGTVPISMYSSTYYTAGESSAFTSAIMISDDGNISEGAENGEIITVETFNDDFVGSINPAN